MPDQVRKPERLIRRRPRRYDLFHRFDDDLELPPFVEPFNPNAGILRRRVPAGLDPSREYLADTLSDPLNVNPVPLMTRPRRVLPQALEDSSLPTPVITRSRPNLPVPVNSIAPNIDSGIRPRRVRVDPAASEPVISRVVVPGYEPFGSSGEPFGSTRLRRTRPRDFLADDTAYLRELEAHKAPRSRKDMALTALFGFLGGGVPGAIANTARYAFDDDARNQFARGPEIERTRGNIQRELLTRKQATDSLNDQSLRDLRETQVENIRRRPEIEANKAEEQHRRTLASLYNRLPEFDPADPANADLVDAMTEARLPVVPKSRANQLRFVQDARTGEWKVISGNRSTGEATGRAIGSEGGTLTTTPNVQIASEDRAAGRESRERVATLNRQSREAIAELNRRARASGGRGNAREEARLTRAVQEITDLENLKTDAISGPVQGRTSALEKAATKAAEIRRLYGDLVDVGYGGDSEGRQWPYAKMKQQGAQGVQQSGAIGRAPASDGKHHYTKAEIRAQAEAADVSYESLYNKLRTNQKVVIEQ